MAPRQRIGSDICSASSCTHAEKWQEELDHGSGESCSRSAQPSRHSHFALSYSYDQGLKEKYDYDKVLKALKKGVTEI
jgi:hypothetical protein